MCVPLIVLALRSEHKPLAAAPALVIVALLVTAVREATVRRSTQSRTSG